MIVLGADTHKGSHTVAGVAARTGEVLGDKTVSVGVARLCQGAEWARGLGRDRGGAGGLPARLGLVERFSIDRGERVSGSRRG